jgi:hypothetical protein
MPATGMASSAPRMPASSTATRIAMSTVNGLSFTVREKISGWSRWFSNCWYSTKNTTVTMPAVVDSVNAASEATTAPSVAPTSGMRSARPTNSAMRLA